ncbi:alpha/beta fold hydrolase [Streptomyces sp. NPDC059175]|uniref:alpha/beta fold hydrolase n=1 Tax=unclassified Streptomyces TaxID=2593676 RepID=UPI0036C09952
MPTATATQLMVGPYTFDALTAGPRDGELVLLLHGFPEFADCWTEEIHALAQAGYQAVAVDQRGYSPGARPEAVEEYAIDKLIADVIGFADALGAERFHLVGHDWGGMVAWALASAYPERLHTLSALSTPHPHALYRALNNSSDQQERSKYVEDFRLPGHIAEQSMLAHDAAGLQAVYRGALSEQQIQSNVRRLADGALTGGLNWYRALSSDLQVPAGEITVPTLYLWGTADRASGREAAELTAEYVKAPYRFVPLEGAPHWLPEASADQVIPFLLPHLAGTN